MVRRTESDPRARDDEPSAEGLLGPPPIIPHQNPDPPTTSQPYFLNSRSEFKRVIAERLPERETAEQVPAGIAEQFLTRARSARVDDP